MIRRFSNPRWSECFGAEYLQQQLNKHGILHPEHAQKQRPVSSPQIRRWKGFGPLFLEIILAVLEEE